MNDYYVLDVETTGATNGTSANPYCPSNRMVVWGIRPSNCGNSSFHFTTSPKEMGGSSFDVLEDSICVGFNIKFDLHWTARYSIPTPKRVWDCQLAQYIIWRQKVPWISLDMCLEHYGFPKKLDVVKKYFWEMGIDTDRVPNDILVEYLGYDLVATENVYQSQLNYLADKPELMRLIQLGNEDILTTLEMEKNGLKADKIGMIVHGNEILREMEGIDAELSDVVDCVAAINWGSSDQCSAALFGGIVREKYRETYTQTLKSGQVKEKSRWSTREIQLPQIYKPNQKWKKDKEGYYSVDEATLQHILSTGNKKARLIAEKLLDRAKKRKAVTSYFHKIPKMMEEYGWGDYIHGTLNHAVTRTGRLASNKPNQQNFFPEFNKYLVSRYG